MILIDQLKEVYIDGELETIDTTNCFPKIRRKDYIVGLNLRTSGPDPDQNLYLFYGCGGELNYNGYCSPEVDKLIDQQSSEADARAAPAAGLGDRTEAGGGRRPADHLLRPPRDLLAAPRQGADAHGQQHLQRLAHGGRLARQVAPRNGRRGMDPRRWTAGGANSPFHSLPQVPVPPCCRMARSSLVASAPL